LFMCVRLPLCDTRVAQDTCVCTRSP
jgi:hypothetical protein